MKTPFTTTLSGWAYKFIISESEKEGTPKNDIIERALKLYKKMKLKNEVEEGLANRQDEYREISSEFDGAQFNALLKNE